jgi:hypothetical protein
MLMSLHLSIASRILLKYANEFNEFVNQLAVELGSTPDKVAGIVRNDKSNGVKNFQ